MSDFYSSAPLPPEPPPFGPPPPAYNPAVQQAAAEAAAQAEAEAAAQAAAEAAAEAELAAEAGTVAVGEEAVAGLALIGPVGWAILGVSALGLAAYGIYRATRSANKNFPNTNPGATQACPIASAGTPSPSATPAPAAGGAGTGGGGGGGGRRKKGRGARFANSAKLQDHFSRHGADFASPTAADYETAADDFLTGSREPGTLEKLRPNGDIVRYNPATGEFGIVNSSGEIRTYFKPDPAVHGYPTNLDYFNAQ